MAIDQSFNVLFPMLGVVVGATLQYWFSKTSEARKHKKEFLEKEISHLLLPLYIQFINIDIETIPNEVDPKIRSFLDELLTNEELAEIITNNLYLASPKLSYYLLEFLHNRCILESEDGKLRDYRSTYGEGEEGGGLIDDDMVLENYHTLKNIIYEEFNEKVRLYQKPYIEKEKKWSFIRSVIKRIAVAIERIKVRRRKLTKFKRHLNRSGLFY
jgi:hypothetical protein